MRLIDADKLKERFMLRAEWLRKDVHNDYSRGLYEGCETDMDLISEISTINPEDFRPKGEWIVCGDGENVPWMCSHCGKTTAHEYKVMYGKFCPNCGAKMEV